MANPNDVIIHGSDAWLILCDRRGQEVARCVIDLADLPLVSQFRWHMGSGSRGGKENRRELRYVMTRISEKSPLAALLPRPKLAHTKTGLRTLKLHHLIAGTPSKGHVTDHIDGDRMNNRRSNLRHVTHRENARNRKKAP